MTNRELFDKTKAHLLAQGRRAQRRVDDVTSGCAYLSPDGLTCAMGCHIKREDYSPWFEGQTVVNYDVVEGRVTEVGRAVGLDASIPRQLNLAHMLQCTHDSVPPSDWATRLDEIERIYFQEGA